MKNPMCENNRCVDAYGEVRLLPTGSTVDKEGAQGTPYCSNAILCRTCYFHEMAHRRERNRHLGSGNQFKLPAWESLKIYDPGE